MALLTMILVLAALTGLVFGALYLVDYVRGDGYGRSRSGSLPRSHNPDPFDPRFRGRPV